MLYAIFYPKRNSSFFDYLFVMMAFGQNVIWNLESCVYNFEVSSELKIGEIIQRMKEKSYTPETYIPHTHLTIETWLGIELVFCYMFQFLFFLFFIHSFDFYGHFIVKLSCSFIMSVFPPAVVGYHSHSHIYRTIASEIKPLRLLYVIRHWLSQMRLNRLSNIAWYATSERAKL